jgi:DNA-binding protein HU-beta
MWGMDVMKYKKDLIAEVASLSGLTQTDVTKAVDGMITAITQALQRRESVCFVGFGTFTTRYRRATQKRNMRTGEIMQIPGAIVPKFKPGKNLKFIEVMKES